MMAEEGNSTLGREDLLTWHGMELFFVPIMMVIGIVGNSCVFYIYHFRWRSNTVTLVKRMLAFLDLSSLILAYPAFLYVTVSPDSNHFKGTCSFLGFILLVSAVTSGMVLLIIAVDRYRKLCLLEKHGIGSVLSKKLFGASLVLAVLINIPTPFVFGEDIIELTHYNTRLVYCFIADEKNDTLFITWGLIVGLIFIGITMALVILYTMIAKKLLTMSEHHDNLKRRPSVMPNEEVIQKHKQSEVMRKSARVFIMITVVFFLSYAPYFVTLILSLVTKNVEASMGPGLKALYDLAKLSPLINNVANPIIYSFDSESFRKEVKKMFTIRAFNKGFFRRRAFSVTSKSFEISETLEA